MYRYINVQFSFSLVKDRLMAWACMAGLLVFMNDMTADRSSRLNSEVYITIHSAQI